MGAFNADVLLTYTSTIKIQTRQKPKKKRSVLDSERSWCPHGLPSSGTRLYSVYASEANTGSPESSNKLPSSAFYTVALCVLVEKVITVWIRAPLEPFVWMVTALDGVFSSGF